MKKLIMRLARWWQRNFGHVYVVDRKCHECYRRRAWLGCVAVTDPYGYPFLLSLGPNGTLLNTYRWMNSYGKPVKDHWTWAYSPQLAEVREGGAW